MNKKSAFDNLKRNRLFFCFSIVLILALLGFIYHYFKPLSISYHIKIKDRMIYSFNYAAAGITDLGTMVSGNSAMKITSDPARAKYSMNTRIIGIFQNTVLEKAENTFLCRIDFKDIDLSLILNDDNSDRKFKEIRLDMLKPVYADINSAGKIKALRLDTTLNEISSSIIKSVLAGTQFVLPGKKIIADSLSWRTKEEDSNGQFWADYRMLEMGSTGAGDVIKFSKQKLEYINPRLKSNRNKVPITPTIKPEGLFIAAFDKKSGVLVSWAGQEEQQFFIGAHCFGKVQITFQQQLIKNESISRQELEEKTHQFYRHNGSYRKVAFDAPRSDKNSRTTISRKQLANSTLKSILTELRNSEHIKSPDYDTTPLFVKLRAFVYLYPDSLMPLEKLLCEHTCGNQSRDVILQALSNVGNHKSQQVLINVLGQNKSESSFREAVLQSLALVDEPSPETTTLLFKLAKGDDKNALRVSALLYLGIAANRLQENAPERSVTICDYLKEQFHSVHDEEQICVLIRAMGNAGVPICLPEIATFISDSSLNIRLAAVSALRFIETDSAEMLLLKVLKSDTEERVRLEAARSLNYRVMTADAFAAQYESFWKETVVSLRFTLLQNLWEARDEFPEVVQLVFEAALQDSSEEIRKNCRNLMLQYPELFG